MKKQKNKTNHAERYMNSIKSFCKATGTLQGIIDSVWSEVLPNDRPDYPSTFVYDMTAAFMNISEDYLHTSQRISDSATQNMLSGKCDHTGGPFETSPLDFKHFAQSAANIRKHILGENLFHDIAKKKAVEEWALDCLDSALEALKELVASILEINVEYNFLLKNIPEND